MPEFNETCSADLLDHKVLVPCKPIEYLNLEYGRIENWMVPRKKNYIWTNLEKKFTNWTESQWVHAIKFYSPRFGFDRKQTLKFINGFLKNKVQKIPDDDIF